MNREIKFRVWDTWANNFMIEELGGFWQSKGYGFESAADILLYTHHGRIIIQLYTGIKDKNDKEIYEGDIIRNNQFKPVEVKYDEYYGGFMPFILRLDEEKEILVNNPEVIGNIFETPELLK